jgi:hypothetical protein
MKQVELLMPCRWQSLAIVYEAVRGVHQADHVRRSYSDCKFFPGLPRCR